MSKYCSKCKEYKNFVAFGICKKSKDGLKSACKQCLCLQGKEYMRVQRLTNKDVLNNRTKLWKQNKRKENLSYYKEEYQKNHNNRLKSAKQYYHKNITLCLDRQKIWREHNLEICRKASRNWKDNHPEKNKELRRSASGAYRARKKQAFTCYFTVDQLMQRMSIFEYKCAYCSGKFEQIDHVIPLSRGGAHCLANLRPACKKCNQSKSNKFLSEWCGKKYE